MTLQQPIPSKGISKSPILCHKCGAPIVFSKDHVSPIGKNVPLDPYFDNAPHAQYCLYAKIKDDVSTEAMLFNFLSLVPSRNHTRQCRIIGAVGKAK